MTGTTQIEWTDSTWNPVTGCTKLSPGCDNCYAQRFAERFRGTLGHPYEQGFDLKLHEDRITQPLRWRKPRHVFVNSMSDIFHASVPRSFVDAVFQVMETTSRHTYQILTKRSGRMRRYLTGRYGANGKTPPAHLWFGVSVEDRARMVRIRHLRETPAATRFLSVEPLLEGLGTIDLAGIHWVIVGGESGYGARQMHEDWVKDIRDQCRAAGTAFFFKQWGGRTPKAGGRELDGRIHDEMPGRG